MLKLFHRLHLNVNNRDSSLHRLQRFPSQEIMGRTKHLISRVGAKKRQKTSDYVELYADKAYLRLHVYQTKIRHIYEPLSSCNDRKSKKVAMPELF